MTAASPLPPIVPLADDKPIWQRCWCYRFGRCLVDCPTANLPRPVPLTDDAWRQAYAEAIRR